MTGLHRFRLSISYLFFCFPSFFAGDLASRATSARVSGSIVSSLLYHCFIVALSVVIERGSRLIDGVARSISARLTSHLPPSDPVSTLL